MHRARLRCPSVKVPDIFPLRALPAGRLAGLGVTRDSCHGRPGFAGSYFVNGKFR